MKFKYYTDDEKQKIYLSAILDLYDRRIVSYVIRNSNNNALVFDTFDMAIAENPNAKPLCHSDRGFQYNKVCPEWQNALTMVPWKASGAS